MSRLLSEILVYPFEKEQLIFPEVGSKTLIWGAEYTPKLTVIKEADWLQTFKPYAEALTLKNIDAITTLEENKTYKNILCTLPKQKEESYYILSRAVSILEQGGLLVVSAANDAGGKRLEKWFLELGLQPQSLSKSKCRIVWAYIKKPNIAKIQEWINKGEPQQITLDGFHFYTKPGIYGWNKIDLGSFLLLDKIENNVSGIGADFGCGYGYLSHNVLDGNKQVKKIYAIDADYNALECCRKNLEKFEKNTSIEYLWEDLSKPLDKIPPLDWIIMNPPFHEGKDLAVQVGHDFIQTAAAALRKNGVLYMVANAHLPYEKLLNQLFAKVDKIEEKQGFKIFKAIQ